jgi:hypothetical protein
LWLALFREDPAAFQLSLVSEALGHHTKRRDITAELLSSIDWQFYSVANYLKIAIKI